MRADGFEFQIRRATSSDLGALLDMVEALTRHHDDVPYVTHDSLARDVLGQSPWFHLFVAETATGLIAYAAALPLARLGHGVRGLDLHHLYVSDSARGRGVGTALVRHVEELARDLGCDYLNIGTHPDNRRAHALYQRLGYELLPTTALRFTRKLTQGPN